MTPWVVLTAAIYYYVVSASVLETTETYSCQKESQTLKWNYTNSFTHCEQSWTTESTPIGSFMNGGVECLEPCINVNSGEISFTGCVNVTLTVICHQGHVTEHRIHFLGTQIPLPQQNLKKRSRYGICACCTLLMLMLAGFAIQHCITHRIRNTGPNRHIYHI